MSKGLSLQQKQILAMLETKTIPNSDRTYFSTQEITCELHPEYALWLVQAEQNPFTRNRKDHIDYPKNDKNRISIYRALRSLEKRGEIVSFTRYGLGRCWVLPCRVKDKQGLWKQEDYERRCFSWRWGAFVRTLPTELHRVYKLGIAPHEDKAEEINRLWKEWKSKHEP